MRGADNLTTFTCRLSWNLGSLTSWNPLTLNRPEQGLLYLVYVSVGCRKCSLIIISRRGLKIVVFYKTHTSFGAHRRAPVSLKRPDGKLPLISISFQLHLHLYTPCVKEQLYLGLVFQQHTFSWLRLTKLLFCSTSKDVMTSYFSGR
jgi:hypothetical protein